MQTGGIGSQDQWTRFMQLSNAARLRNQGLVPDSRGPKRTGQAQSMPVSSSLPLRARSAIHRSYTAPAQAATAARILGGAFDAYA